MEHPSITKVTQSDCTKRQFSEREKNSWKIAQNFERYVRDRRSVAYSIKEDEFVSLPGRVLKPAGWKSTYILIFYLIKAHFNAT
jgi:hypothetical protein